VSEEHRERGRVIKLEGKYFKGGGLTEEKRK